MTATAEPHPGAEDQGQRWAGVLGTHRADLVRTARSRLGARGADAEDVVHDVAVRVLRRGRSIEDVDAPGAYLRRAVGNECVSRWRRTSHEVTVAELPDRPRPAHDETVLDRIALSEAMAALTERQRRVIVLTVVEDRPDDEVAGLLGVSEITVRTTRSRALARLRARLEAMDTDEPQGRTPSAVTRIAARPMPLRIPA
ncbi:MAG TPA: sigma-70 family RNA polymerase sigma factor [Mycobacteriales bacterium]|nr:sigma-70 family RNA polymerase sigma factor [Mycobacteriales bacterium]